MAFVGKLLKYLLYVILAIGLVVAIYLFAMRFADGPSGPVAGGPFKTGELYTGTEPDWNTLKDRMEVEFQLLDPERSRTTWIVVHDNRIFIPSGYMTTGWGKLWKQWPVEAEEDGRAILRVDNTLYNRQLVRVKSGPLLAPLTAELDRKYGGGAGNITPEAVASNYLWLFELTPR